jgi:aspartyl protease family protein
MLRYYFAFIVAVAIGTALLSGGQVEPTAAVARADEVIAVTAEPPAIEAAALQSASGGLTLKREPDGHFYADTLINGASIRMLVDTGASGIALSRDDARRAGIGISIGMPNVVGQGAGGDVHGEMVMLDRVSLGGESASAMPAIVLDGGDQSLLGQAFLGKFASVEIRGDTMVLR